MQPTKTVKWSFTAKFTDVDFRRVFDEAPSDCRVLWITTNEGYRIAAIRYEVLKRARESGVKFHDTILWDALQGYAKNQYPTLYATGKPIVSSVYCEWLWSCTSDNERSDLTLDIILDWLRRVDEHYARSITVEVMAV
jgi:hypothetical protein